MTVILVDPRRPSLVPVEAIALLAGELAYTEEIPVAVPWSLPAARPVFEGPDAPVLLSSDADHPAVKARLAAGEDVITAPDPNPGERLIDAVALMDKLRTDGPWEGEQTHDSLRRYLLEETYEVFDAVRSGNADDLREELGDVLLQVLFHARIAEDAPQHPFTIDDVADSLLRKLGNRVPGVLAGEPISLEQQIAEWDERKAQENSVKSRNSCLDGVPTGQPALALAQKVLGRVTVAGLPADLIPSALTTVVVTPDGDVENTLRTDVLEFIDAVRQAERTIAATRRGDEVPEELDIAVLDSVTAQEWHAAWPLPVATEPAEELDESAEATGETEVTGDTEDTGETEATGETAGPEEPEATGEAEPQAQPAVIEEEFPATEMPVITEAEVASNGVTDEFEEMAPAEGQPDSVEPQS